ncbi:MAG: hypothetical protein KFB95_07640 [Simkaniaceae bacterium]|nr:MAG: hypothetical protein KFB95_07640 [Simkaniaceae bacterium]
MNIKRLGGNIAFLIGVILICYGLYGSYRMFEAHRDIEQKTKYVPGEGFREFIQDEFGGEVDKYTVPVVLCYVGGVIFLVGGWILIRSSKRKK